MMGGGGGERITIDFGVSRVLILLRAYAYISAWPD